MGSDDLSSSAGKVQAVLAERGYSYVVKELPASTRTAQEAAAAIGCQVDQIIKSLIFERVDSGQLLLVLVSGKNRVDESRLATFLGEKVKKAHPTRVRELTGFAIGGVPPVGHDEPLETVIDDDLMDFNTLWAAAGNPHAVFRVFSVDLPGLTGGTVTTVT